MNARSSTRLFGGDVERWILACLRNETFYSLADLNERIAELLKRLLESKEPTLLLESVLQRAINATPRRRVLEGSSHPPIVLGLMCSIPDKSVAHD